jgi:hypothetical protein
MIMVAHTQSPAFTEKEIDELTERLSPPKTPARSISSCPQTAKVEMPEIRIDADKAQRMIAQILREDKGLRLLPADANKMAEIICRRLSSAMPLPTNQPLQGYRIIPSFPPDGFHAALATKIADVNLHGRLRALAAGP